MAQVRKWDQRRGTFKPVPPLYPRLREPAPAVDMQEQVSSVIILGVLIREPSMRARSIGLGR